MLIMLRICISAFYSIQSKYGPFYSTVHSALMEKCETEFSRERLTVLRLHSLISRGVKLWFLLIFKNIY